MKEEEEEEFDPLPQSVFKLFVWGVKPGTKAHNLAFSVGGLKW